MSEKPPIRTQTELIGDVVVHWVQPFPATARKPVLRALAMAQSEELQCVYVVNRFDVESVLAVEMLCRSVRQRAILADPVNVTFHVPGPWQPFPDPGESETLVRARPKQTLTEAKRLLSDASIPYRKGKAGARGVYVHRARAEEADALVTYHSPLIVPRQWLTFRRALDAAITRAGEQLAADLTPEGIRRFLDTYWQIVASSDPMKDGASDTVVREAVFLFAKAAAERTWLDHATAHATVDGIWDECWKL